MSLHANTGTTPQLSHDRFLPNPHQFITFGLQGYSQRLKTILLTLNGIGSPQHMKYLPQG